MTNILVVDDDEEFRKMLYTILSDEGYSVTCVRTGKEAIEASYKILFNLALVDINLPDIEGTDLLILLRETEPELIKIMVTGKPTLDNSINSANKGISGFIVKPFDPKKLLALIETKLKDQQDRIRFDETKVAEYIETRSEWMSSGRFRK